MFYWNSFYKSKYHRKTGAANLEPNFHPWKNLKINFQEKTAKDLAEQLQANLDRVKSELQTAKRQSQSMQTDKVNFVFSEKKLIFLL